MKNTLEAALDAVAIQYRAYCVAIQMAVDALSEDTRIRNHPERRIHQDSLTSLALSLPKFMEKFEQTRRAIEKNVK